MRLRTTTSSRIRPAVEIRPAIIQVVQAAASCGKYAAARRPFHEAHTVYSSLMSRAITEVIALPGADLFLWKREGAKCKHEAIACI
jgi:hypothetical protein